LDETRGRLVRVGMAMPGFVRVTRVPVMIVAVVAAGTMDVLWIERRIGYRHAYCSWD
jgi:hypothetical protein